MNRPTTIAIIAAFALSGCQSVFPTGTAVTNNDCITVGSLFFGSVSHCTTVSYPKVVK